MKLLTLILFALFALSISSLRILKGDQIPKDYTLGQIMQFSFLSDGRMFFKAVNEVFGFIDGKTGKIVALYVIEKDENVVDVQGEDEIIINKGKAINVFNPLQEKYIRLQASDFLQKQQFKKVLKFKRFFMYDYILTDTFLLQAHNPFEPTQIPQSSKKAEQMKILAKQEKDQQFFTLIFLGSNDMQSVGIGLVSLKNGNKQICLRKFYLTGDISEKLCYNLDTAHKFSNVVEMGDYILIIYQKKKQILDLKMKKLKQTKQKEMITFVNELNIMGEEQNGKNLNSDEEGRTMQFFDMGTQSGSNNVAVFSKYMLVKKGDKVIANIPKSQKDQPRNLWAHTYQQGVQGFLMIVEYENNKLQAYKINQAKKTFKLVWEIVVKEAKAISGGKAQEPQIVSLKEEEKVLEEANEPNREKQGLKQSQKQLAREAQDLKRQKQAQQREKNKQKQEEKGQEPVPDPSKFDQEHDQTRQKKAQKPQQDKKAQNPKMQKDIGEDKPTTGQTPPK